MTASQQSRDTALANQGLTPENAARYLKGAPPETDQFGFFVGDWSCELRVHAPGADAPLTLRAEWRAKWLHDRRILFDDLTVFLPGGEEVLGWLNLRTYSEATGHWEITGQRVLEPATGTLTIGTWRDGEMHLDFETAHGDGRLSNRVRFHAITPASFEWEWEHRLAADRPWTCFAAISATRM